MTRRILVLGEGATELREPGQQVTGAARTLLSRYFGAPPPELLTFEQHVLSNFRRDLDFAEGLRVRGEDAQARIARMLATTKRAHGLVLFRDSDRGAQRGQGDRRAAIERGFAEAAQQGHATPAALALAIECIEAWALSDPEAWARVFGKVPKLPSSPEALWGNWREEDSQHPKSVLRRCLEEIGCKGAPSATARLLEHASFDRIAAACPEGFGRFRADLERAFPRIACVVAAGRDRAIGLDGDLPWGAGTLRAHAKHVLELTAAPQGTRHAVVLGRRTWEALQGQPPVLRNCLSLVVSRGAGLPLPSEVHPAASFDEALAQAVAAGVRQVFVLGGGQLYREALGHFRCTELHYTRVDQDFPGADVSFPDFEHTDSWTRTGEPAHHHDNGFDYAIERWRRFVP